MKTFKNCAAQGDLLIRRIDCVPAGATKASPENGKYILAHSETQHHHSVSERQGVDFFTTQDPLVAYLSVIDSVEVVLEHERTFDTHEPLLIKGGTYEIRRQREYVPNGWRKVED